MVEIGKKDKKLTKNRPKKESKSDLNPNALPFIPDVIEPFDKNETLENMFSKFEKDRQDRLDKAKKGSLNVKKLN